MGNVSPLLKCHCIIDECCIMPCSHFLVGLNTPALEYIHKMLYYNNIYNNILTIYFVFIKYDSSSTYNAILAITSFLLERYKEKTWGPMSGQPAPSNSLCKLYNDCQIT